jgi:hypothetical protein
MDDVAEVLVYVPVARPQLLPPTNIACLYSCRLQRTAALWYRSNTVPKKVLRIPTVHTRVVRSNTSATEASGCTAVPGGRAEADSGRTCRRAQQVGAQ